MPVKFWYDSNKTLGYCSMHGWVEVAKKGAGTSAETRERLERIKKMIRAWKR